LALTALEVVLGVDNLVFISLMANKLPAASRDRVWKVGLGMAAGMRILLLFAITWVIGLTAPLFSVLNHTVSGRDLILLGGGLFLLAKAVIEIHEQLYPGTRHDDRVRRTAATFAGVLTQIALLDMVFSLDSVITAVGMADRISVMIAAVLIAVGVMMWLSSPVMRIVNEHPTIRMLALAFLLLIGVSLVAEGGGAHLPKGYIYSAMGFAVLVELLNMRMRRNQPAGS
jgi:predicted tellurium resistance membrane protein TerC